MKDEYDFSKAERGKFFRETVRARVERDPGFREALFQEAVQALLHGQIDDGRAGPACLY